MGSGAVAVGGVDCLKRIIDPNRKWYNNRRLIALNAWIVLLLITSATNGYDGSMMNGLQSLPQWTSAFNNPSGTRLGLLNAIQNIGCLAAYPFAPYMSDILGRRRTVFIGAVIMIVATALQTASLNVGMFIGARFLIGLGVTFAANAAPLLVAELSYPTYRASLTSMYNSLWYFGAIVAAWSTFGTFKLSNSWAWRIPSLLQCFPSVIQVAFILFAPESPRWLMSKGLDMQALEVLAYYHADGNEQDPLVIHEFQEIKNSIEIDKAVAFNVGWSSLFSSPGNRKRVRIIVALAFFSQWSGNGLVSYYLKRVFDEIGITDHSTQLVINGVLQIWNLFWAVLSSFFVERLGRRFLFLTSAVGMLIFFTLQTACSAQFVLHGTPSAARAVVAFIFLFYASYDLAFTPLIVSYTIEILPYPLRAKGFTLFNFIISVALVFNQYVNPIAMDHMSWKYYIVYCCWLIVEVVFLYFFILETKNRSLEETAALFDGEDALDRVSDAIPSAVRDKRKSDTQQGKPFLVV